METSPFFRPENIFLVVGATENEEKFGSKVFLDLKGAGYNVVAVNNKTKPGDEIHGTPAYPSVTAFLERVEKLFDAKKRHEAHARIVLILIVPPPAALAVVTEARAHDITKAWFQPGAESDDAIRFCEEHGIDCVHDACIMLRRRG